MIRIRLSALLGERCWTQADLSRMTGIRATTISDMYNNFAERVGLDQLDLICEALDCELGDLLILVPNSSPRITYNRAGNLIPQQKRKPRIK